MCALNLVKNNFVDRIYLRPKYDQSEGPAERQRVSERESSSVLVIVSECAYVDVRIYMYVCAVNSQFRE